jgi:hypothetical protein
VYFGGSMIGSGSTANFQPFTPTTINFTVTSASGALAFTNESAAGDHTYMLDNVTLTQTSTTAPEPATVALLGGGLLALAGVARRRRQQA